MSTEAHELTADAVTLQQQLRHVYWIGGGSCAGKSTIARRIAAEHGLQHYPTDNVMADHAKRSTPEDCPFLHEFMAMDMDDTVNLAYLKCRRFVQTSDFCAASGNISTLDLPKPLII